MIVSQEDAIIYLLRRSLVLDAQVMVLRSAVSSLAEKLNPGCHDDYLKSLKTAEQVACETLLLNHPYLKEDFDDLLKQF